MQSKIRHLSFGILVILMCGGMAALAWTPTTINPVPLVYQPLLPSAAAPRSGAFVLTVRGCGFVASSTVRWNGLARVTTFVSNSELTAEILAGDVRTPGTASVTVETPGPRPGISNTVFFPIATPTSGVAFGRADFPVNPSPMGVAVADFNGDGRQDIASVDIIGNTVSILLGNGDGTFQSHVDYATGSMPEGMTVGDFNGDGRPDLAIADTGSGTVSVLLGNGDGTFQPRTDFPAVAGVAGLITADFNGDGIPDLAVEGGGVAVLLGNGDGTFQAPLTVNSRSLQPSSVVAGDFNGDGKLDLAVSNFGNNKISILLGHGDGTFSFGNLKSIQASNPERLVTADFNGDGKLDLVATTTGNTGASIFLGNGDGTFQNGRTLNIGTLGRKIDVIAGDFNADGNLDLAIGAAEKIVTLLGNGNGTFQAPLDFSTGQYLATGDFNGDGRLDYASVGFNNNIAVGLQLPVSVNLMSLTFPLQLIGIGSQPQSVILDNGGLKRVTIFSISTTSGFTQTSDCPTSLLGGANCTINVVFTTTQSGIVLGTLTVKEGGNMQQTVSLSGSGNAIEAMPLSLNFGNQKVGTISASQPVVVTNLGGAAVSFSITFDNPGFGQSNNCGSTLAGHASCTINVTFAPTMTGPFVSLMFVGNGTAYAQQSVMVTGTGIN